MDDEPPLVAITQFAEPMEAKIVQSKLAAYGIASQVSGLEHAMNYPMIGQRNGLTLWVPSDLEQTVRRLLDEPSPIADAEPYTGEGSRKMRWNALILLLILFGVPQLLVSVFR